MFLGIKGILFDFDDTLWDFQANAETALIKVWQMIQHYGDISATKQQEFLLAYKQHNDNLWREYRQGKRDALSIRTTRFRLAAADVGVEIDDAFTQELAESYLIYLYEGKKLVAGTREILAYLKLRYKLGLITNGFAQGLERLKTCQLQAYFDFYLCSEEYGHPKPHAGIFKHAVEALGLMPSQCVYIGDNYEGDIIGAKQAGLRAIYFNKNNKSYHQYELQPDQVITALTELKTMF